MVCPYCNNRSVPNAVVCNHCGVILKHAKSARKSQKPYPWRRLVLAAVGYVVAAVGGGLIGYVAGHYLLETKPSLWPICGVIGLVLGIVLVYLVSVGSLFLKTARLNARRKRVQSEIHRIEEDREKRLETVQKELEGGGADTGAAPELRLELAAVHLIEGQIDEGLQQLQQAYQLGLGNRVDFLNNAGVAFGQRGQMHLSVERFQQAAHVDPKAMEPRVNLVYSLFKTGDKDTIDKFIGPLDGGMETLENDPAAARRFGLSYAMSGNTSNAQRYIDTSLKKGDRDDQSDAQNDSGVVKALAGSSKAAISSFQQAIHLDSSHAPAIANLGVIYYRQGRYDDAAERFEAATAVDPHSGLAHSLLGAAYCRLNLINEGIREFRDARIHEMHLFEPNYNLGKVYIEQDVHDQAERYLVRAYEINPYSWQTLVAQAVLLFKQGLIDKSLAVYEQALQVQPNEVRILGGLALCTSLQGDYVDSEKYFKNALALAPNDIDLLTNFSWHYLIRSEVKQAVVFLEKVIELNRKAAVANNNMGLCQMEMGAHDAATQYFKQALQSDSSLHTVHYNLGNDYIAQKAISNAIDSWEKAQKVETGNADLYTNLGVAYYKTEKFDKAVLEFRRVQSLRQERMEDYVNLGLSYARMKRNKEAIEQFELAIHLDPNNPMIHSNLGLACYFANQVEDAMREWRTVTQISSQYAKLRGAKQQSEYDDAGIDYVPLYVSERALHTQPRIPDYAVPFIPGYGTSQWELMTSDEDLQRLKSLKYQRDRADRAIRALKV